VEIVEFTTVRTRQRFIKALIYGHGGAGKTKFTADAPNPFWLDYESSTETLYHYPEYLDIPVETPSDIDDLKRWVNKIVKDPRFETVVLDTVTTALDYYMRQEADKRANKRDRFVFFEQDYKYATQVFTELFGFLQNAPINVVIIGHERVARNKESGTIEGIFPDITPRLQQAVTRLVNVVGYLQATTGNNGTRRRLYLNQTSIIEAKNRLNIQTQYVENPTWKEIFND
jgi:phage nucleotide-binding protein